jgi:transcriptional regulator with PAS, ATPase and Fis domain
MNFIHIYNQQFNKTVQGISPGVHELLIKSDWPGNIRQLRNFIERAMVLCKTDIIDEQLFKQAVEPTADNYTSASRITIGQDAEKRGMLAEIETTLIKKLLSETRGDKHEVAKILGISDTTLWRRMKEIGI